MTLSTPPPDSQRDRVLRALRDAGVKGCTAEDFMAAGVSHEHAHIESLIFEGHFIPSFTVEERGQLVRRWALAKDAWA